MKKLLIVMMLMAPMSSFAYSKGGSVVFVPSGRGNAVIIRGAQMEAGRIRNSPTKNQNNNDHVNQGSSAGGTNHCKVTGFRDPSGLIHDSYSQPCGSISGGVTASCDSNGMCSLSY